MYKDEKNQPIKIDELVSEVQNDQTHAPTKDALEKELAAFYLQHQTSQFASFNLEDSTVSSIMAAATPHKLLIGGGIWEKIRAFICKVLKPNSTIEEIIQAVLDTLADIIPGANLIKALVRKIVKYILSIGIPKLCPVG